MAKPKVAFYWCGSCGGCEETIVDIGEELLDIVEKIEIVFWPIAFDFKLDDVKKLSKGEIAVCFINGTITNTENIEVVKILRECSKYVVAFGSCSHMGGIPALRNFYPADSVVRYAYIEVPSVDNPEGVLPTPEWTDPEGRTLTIPKFTEKAMPLGEVIDVDYYLPGCPPPPNLVKDAINRFLTGDLPEKGSVLIPSMALCYDCPRRDTKPDKIKLSELKRLDRVQPDPSLCFLAQGIICLGPITRTGCGHRCIMANMPCRGCFGPVDRVKDMGVDLIGALASLIDADPDDSESMKEIFNKLGDLSGTLWRFSNGKNVLLDLKKKEG